MLLKDKLLENSQQIRPLRNPDLDKQRGFCSRASTLMGQVVANMKDPDHRQNAIDDVKPVGSGKMMQVARQDRRRRRGVSQNIDIASADTLFVRQGSAWPDAPRGPRSGARLGFCRADLRKGGGVDPSPPRAASPAARTRRGTANAENSRRGSAGDGSRAVGCGAPAVIARVCRLAIPDCDGNGRRGCVYGRGSRKWD